ncbi:MAG: PilT/PilU family type 4a pilus ATPase [Armatimonadota bacterium]
MTTITAGTNVQTIEILRRDGLLPADIVPSLLGRAETADRWVGEIALADGLISGDELAAALAGETALPRIDLSKHQAEEGTLACVAKDFSLRHLMLPLTLNGGVLHVAMANPLDRVPLNGLLSASTAVSVSVATVEQVRDYAERWYAGVAFGKDACLLNATDMGTAPTTDDRYVRTLTDLLHSVVEERGSDLHLTVGAPPLIRVDGELTPLAYPKITQTQMSNMLLPIIPEVSMEEFKRTNELDMSYTLPGYARFRVNIYRQRGSLGSAFRYIPTILPTLQSLGMPEVLRDLTTRRRGLVLVTGPTGVGKSTTLAAMIEEINRTRHAHIMTIEDPIEFLHRHGKCEINQREVGADTEGFAQALRRITRQDPDIILIGEMRDPETIAAALTAAETGHLVLSTLHTTSAVTTVDRIIDVFPPHQQTQVRMQLASVLEGVVTQVLLPSLEGIGRHCAQEILVLTDAVRNMIREGKTHMIPSVMQSSAKQGMQTMDQALKVLVQERKVAQAEAELHASSVDYFRSFLNS